MNPPVKNIVASVKGRLQNREVLKGKNRVVFEEAVKEVDNFVKGKKILQRIKDIGAAQELSELDIKAGLENFKSDITKVFKDDIISK